MARYDDLNTTAIAYATFVGAIVLLVLILLGRALCYSWVESEDEHKLANAHYEVSDTKISEQKSLLGGYHKVQVEIGEATKDKPAETKQVLHIPIERAKELLLGEMHKSEPST